MTHFSYFRTSPGGGREPLPEPRRAEPGRWPMLEAALAVVNRDLTATLPDQDELILMIVPSSDPATPSGGIDGERVHVAMPDGRWHGEQVNPWEVEEGEEGGPPEPDDAATALAVVAEAAQTTVTELLWQVWPVCGEHKIGMHVRRAGTADDYACECVPGAAADPAGPPVWWCRGGADGRDGKGHDVAPVGELAATLPGKQRRAVRRTRRRSDGPR